MCLKFYLLPLLCGFILIKECTLQSPMPHAPPVPGLPGSDPPRSTTAGTPEDFTPKYLTNYIPAVMQALAYYTERMMYTDVDMTTVQPPYTGGVYNDGDSPDSSWHTTTKKPWTTRPTTQRPTQWTRRTTPSSFSDQTTPLHSPGYYGPDNPLTLYSQILKPDKTAIQPTEPNRSQFFNWFFQSTSKQLNYESEIDLQYLDPLPKQLHQDINEESYEPPALQEHEIVEQFLKKYDDFHGKDLPKKRIPPTKPYVEFLMLYDLLKREAKQKMLNKYQGYSEEMLLELNEISKNSAERQMHALLSRMLARGDTERKDVIARAKSIVEDLENPADLTHKTLIYIPALSFLI